MAVPGTLDLASTITVGLAGGEVSPAPDDDGGVVPFYERYRLTGSLPRGYWLRSQLPVDVRLEGEEFAAVQPHLNVHAFGETPIDAVTNLREELVDLAVCLEDAGERLAPRLVRQRDLLRQLIARDA